METLVGIIGKIIYEDDKNDFKVFQLKRKDRSVVRVAGEFPVLLSGTKVEVHGNYKNHHKYGISFNSDAHTFGYDQSAQSVALYIQSIAKWIGPERSWALAQHFGDLLQEVIEKTPERLSEVEGIGEKVAASLSEAWELNKEMKGIRIFLHSLGLTQLRIKKLITMFGPNTEEILKENPWILFQHGFGFTTCDSIASKLEKNMQSPIRYQYFILHVLNECLSSGHLFLHPQQILDAFNRYNSKTPYPFKNGELNIYDIASHVKMLIKEGYIINDSNRLYQIDNFFYESESARLLSKLKTSPEPFKLAQINVDGFINRYEGYERITLSEAQKEAIQSFVSERVFIVTGSPGTGKTTIIKAMVQLMRENAISYELLTPTGISAKKLGNTTQSEAYTIHRRLGYKGNKWDYNAHNKYDTQVVVVDEMSMVDQEVFYRLVSALHSTTRLIFVGDNDQLPSVGPGCVLRELIESKLIKTISLHHIFRQEACSDIIKEAKKIRDGDTDLSLFSSDKTRDIWHINEKVPDRIEQIILKFSHQLKENAKIKGKSLYFQIITPRNQGPCSVDTLNVVLQAALNPPDKDKKEIHLNQSVIRKGDRVMIRKNNYQLGVFNGDIGKVVFITPEHVVVDLEDIFDDKRRVEIPMRIADEMIKLAYTITVHKCIPKDQLITTKRGIIPIEQVVKGDHVLSHDEWKKVLWCGAAGSKPGLRFTTRAGYTFDSSYDHRFLIANDSNPVFKKASEIYTGDYAVYPLRVIEGIDIPINFQNRVYKSQSISIKLPKHLDEDLSWLLGVIIGDSCYTDVDDGMIELTGPTKKEILQKAQGLFEKYGLRVGVHKKKGKKYSIYVCSKNFREWLLSIGVNYSVSRDKTIPPIIFQSNISCRKSFISGLIDTDGCADKKAQIRYTTASKKLAHDFQLLLLSLGIVGFRLQEGLLHYKVIVSGPDYPKFKSMFQLVNPKKANVISQYESSMLGKTNHYEIPFGKHWVNDFVQAYKAHSGPTRGVKGKGLTSKYPEFQGCLSRVRSGINKFRYPLLLKMKEISDMEGFKLPLHIQEEIDRYWYYNEITNIEKISERQMWDMEVEGAHSYTTEGALCHNSQGGEYPMVIIPLIKAHGALLLQRNLLYTAITRAKKKVIIIGQLSAVESCIKNDKIQKRNTRFSERIKEWIQGKGTSMRDMFSTSSGYQNAAILERLLLLEEKGG